ncbi:MAG TPA: hypothetical protein VK881_15445 [bacterium]|nr:hypothetical protein [bacterium]
MRAALRWCGAVAVGVAAFEGLDLAASRAPMLSWFTLASPFVAGAAAAWTAGPGIVAPLLVAAAVPWARIGVDRAVGMLHGVTLPPEIGPLVIAFFGVSWTGMSVTAGAAVTVARRVAGRAVRGRASTAAPRA